MTGARIQDGRLILPVDQQQRDILGRGVMAELRVAALEAENLQLRLELATLKRELEALVEPAAEPEKSTRRRAKPAP